MPGSPALPTCSSSVGGNYETWAQEFLLLALGIASLGYTSAGLPGAPPSALVLTLGRKATMLLGTFMVSSFVLFNLESSSREELAESK